MGPNRFKGWSQRQESESEGAVKFALLESKSELKTFRNRSRSRNRIFSQFWSRSRSPVFVTELASNKRSRDVVGSGVRDGRSDTLFKFLNRSRG